MVFAAATAGSPLARAVIDEGGRSLAALVGQLASRGVAVDDVVVAGSTILAQPVLYEAFVSALADRVPGARPQHLRVPPVDGALALARSLV